MFNLLRSICLRTDYTAQSWEVEWRKCSTNDQFSLLIVNILTYEGAAEDTVDSWILGATTPVATRREAPMQVLSKDEWNQLAFFHKLFCPVIYSTFWICRMSVHNGTNLLSLKWKILKSILILYYFSKL